MKIIISTLLLCFAVNVYAGTAAGPLFVVYFSKGKNIKKAGKTTYMLKKGDAIAGTDKITIPRGAELTLLCASHTVVKVTAGTYLAQSLKSRCGTPQSSFTATYFKYVWQQMTHHHAEAADKPEQFMKTAGAVARGQGEAQFDMAADTIFYNSGALKLKLGNAQKPYLFKIFDDATSDHIVKNLKVNGALPLDTVADITGRGNYYWQLCGTDNRDCSKRAYIKIMPDEEYSEAVNQLLGRIVQTGVAETAFMTGFILEENHFLAEAYKYYRLALNAEPENIIYQTAINRFYE